MLQDVERLIQQELQQQFNQQQQYLQSQGIVKSDLYIPGSKDKSQSPQQQQQQEYGSISPSSSPTQQQQPPEFRISKNKLIPSFNRIQSRFRLTNYPFSFYQSTNPKKQYSNQLNIDRIAGIFNAVKGIRQITSILHYLYNSRFDFIDQHQRMDIERLWMSLFLTKIKKDSERNKQQTKESMNETENQKEVYKGTRKERTVLQQQQYLYQVYLKELESNYEKKDYTIAESIRDRDYWEQFNKLTRFQQENQAYEIQVEQRQSDQQNILYDIQLTKYILQLMLERKQKGEEKRRNERENLDKEINKIPIMFFDLYSIVQIVQEMLQDEDELKNILDKEDDDKEYIRIRNKKKKQKKDRKFKLINYQSLDYLIELLASNSINKKLWKRGLIVGKKQKQLVQSASLKPPDPPSLIQQSLSNIVYMVPTKEQVNFLFPLKQSGIFPLTFDDINKMVDKIEKKQDKRKLKKQEENKGNQRNLKKMKKKKEKNKENKQIEEKKDDEQQQEQQQQELKEEEEDQISEGNSCDLSFWGSSSSLEEQDETKQINLKKQKKKEKKIQQKSKIDKLKEEDESEIDFDPNEDLLVVPDKYNKEEDRQMNKQLNNEYDIKKKQDDLKREKEQIRRNKESDKQAKKNQGSSFQMNEDFKKKYIDGKWEKIEQEMKERKEKEERKRNKQNE
ncbi:MAG: hypothetical protein EZS28_001896 [Streblomastix strix]|uniref:Uncharacterized protein n=1 Tax=Streblomastix strix TaxID=222440 RepID=A0A5J4X758_9EUKA|nr:MAG: hypothetical protein EZS28_001896 [Streblomastix strix]